MFYVVDVLCGDIRYEIFEKKVASVLLYSVGYSTQFQNAEYIGLNRIDIRIYSGEYFQQPVPAIAEVF